MQFITSLFQTPVIYPVCRENLPPQEQTADNTYKYVVDANVNTNARNFTKFTAEVKHRLGGRRDIPATYADVGTFNTVQDALDAIKEFRDKYAWDFNNYDCLVGRVKVR